MRSEVLEALSADLRARDIDTVAVACDLTRAEECQTAIDRLIKCFGGIDVLVNNAGIAHRSAFRDTSLEVFQRVMAVNFFGSPYCAKAALKSLIDRDGLVIVISMGYFRVAVKTA